MSKTLMVFLHGSGGTGPDLRSFLDTVPLEQFCMKTFRSVAVEMNIEYVCPTANLRPYTAAMGQPMNVWFDRTGDFIRKGLNDLEDVHGANASIENVLNLVHSAESSYEHIFVGGFSQGGCLCLHMLRSEFSIRHSRKLRGIFSMGSFLVNSSVVLQEQRIVSDDSRSDLPTFMMHGVLDSMIRLEWGEATATSLLLKDREVQFKVYPDLDHEIGVSELVDLLYWIDDVRGTLTSSSNTDTSVQSTTQHTTPLSTVIRNSTMLIDAEKELLGATAVHGNSEYQCVPYTLSKPYGIDSVVMAIFELPTHLASMATARPILACGGSFELRVRDGSGSGSGSRPDVTAVQTEVISSDPNHTAREIGKRLFIR